LLVILLIRPGWFAGLLALAWAKLSRTPFRELGFIRPTNLLITLLSGTLLGVVFKIMMKAIVMPSLGAPSVNQAYFAGLTARSLGTVRTFRCSRRFPFCFPQKISCSFRSIATALTKKDCALVVTSFVRIAGVLLVFTYLIVPAVCGINLAQRIGNRLLIGWIVALIGGVAGLFLSYWWDLPSGAAIVCTFGALLILISFIGLWRRRVRLIPGKPDGR
jgi:hypothetical protein